MALPDIVINEEVTSNQRHREYALSGLSRLVVLYSRGTIKTQFGANLFMVCFVIVALVAIFIINGNNQQSEEDLKKYIFDPATTIPESVLYEKK